MKKELNLIFLFIMLMVTIAAGDNRWCFHWNNAGGASRNCLEPGLFYREIMLKEGVVMVMPDIRDQHPKMTFLPYNILAKLPPFSTSKIDEMKVLLKVSDNSRNEKIMRDSIRECEGATSDYGESKRCVKSMQEMVDFVTSILGHNVVVRTTKNVNGSGKNVMIGRVDKIMGGNMTRSVGCHKQMFPSMLLYYCDSSSMVRVYQVDLLDPKSKDKINQVVAVCHLDTSSWSTGHPAFVALGSGPGRIEACHWIFENDMSWTIAD